MEALDSMYADLLQFMSGRGVWQQLLIIGVALGIAALFAIRASRGAGQSVHAGGLRRLAFPLCAVLLILVARFVAHHNGWPRGLLVIATQLLLAAAVVRIVVFALRYAIKAPWVASFEKTIALLIWCGVALDIVGIWDDLVVWAEQVTLPIGKESISLWGILQGCAMVMATMIGALWLGGLAEGRLMSAPALDMSIKVVMSRIIKALLVVLAVLLGMSMAGLDITTLSVFGGALGVGLGFGMQKIASNYVSGFIILLDRSIQIGHIIQVNDKQRGEVRQITTRYTLLRSGDGIHFIVPNETLVGSLVQNDTFADRRMRLVTRIQVGYGTDVERVLPIMAEIARAHPRIMTEPAPEAFLVSFDDSGITLELGMWIADPENGQTGVRSAINREILRRFREERIEIPFPQRELRVLNWPEQAVGNGAPPAGV
ncbi:MAG: mechanosensitive ion channel [Moraxellaceae bacterium]|nr:mechanosensitive ion channel [Moraxellaceae bacterium]